jgi:hypothetical protein
MRAVTIALSVFMTVWLYKGDDTLKVGSNLSAVDAMAIARFLNRNMPGCGCHAEIRLDGADPRRDIDPRRKPD